MVTTKAISFEVVSAVLTGNPTRIGVYSVTTEAQKKANARYQKKSTKNISIRFMPSDSALLEWLDNQPNKAGYIKQLIREDMMRQGENRTHLDTGVRK